MVVPPRSPIRRRQNYNLKRFFGSFRDALFKVSLDPTHLVSYVCKAKHRAIASPRKSVERCRLHLRDEDRKRGSDNAAKDTIFMPAFTKDIEIGVEASPTGVTVGQSSVA